MTRIKEKLCGVCGYPVFGNKRICDDCRTDMEIDNYEDRISDKEDLYTLGESDLEDIERGLKGGMNIQMEDF